MASFSAAQVNKESIGDRANAHSFQTDVLTYATIFTASWSGLSELQKEPGSGKPCDHGQAYL